MKGRVFELQRCCVHDGPGVRTTVFLAGCALRCAWCHNPEGLTATCGRLVEAREVLDEVLRDREFYAASGGGVTVSGGEPLLQAAFVRELLTLARAQGLHTCVQTAGEVPAAAVEQVLDVVDLFQFDLKHLDPARHRELTGVGNERILSNAALLLARGARVEFRVPLVPGLTDDDENLARTAAFLARHGVRALRLVPYHGLYVDKYARLGLEARCADLPSASPEALAHAASRLRGAGLEVAVDG